MRTATAALSVAMATALILIGGVPMSSVDADWAEGAETASEVNGKGTIDDPWYGVVDISLRDLSADPMGPLNTYYVREGSTLRLDVGEYGTSMFDICWYHASATESEIWSPADIDKVVVAGESWDIYYMVGGGVSIAVVSASADLEFLSDPSEGMVTYAGV